MSLSGTVLISVARFGSCRSFRASPVVSLRARFSATTRCRIVLAYVRGIIKGDEDDGCIVDATGRKVSLPRGSSDAALAPYHVERSKLFVLDRLAAVEELDGARITRTIGFTQFPYRSPPDEMEIDEEGSLLRAADLIGQLSDPHYLRKANALYHEFEEVCLNKQFGYESPADLFDKEKMTMLRARESQG
jgi:hypothetical protein